MIVSREECEKQLSLALSRYVGYTTGAYHIVERIREILSEFDTRPYILEIELVNKIHKKIDNIGANYALGAINFTTGLGFLDRYEQGGGTARYALSDLGRVFKASVALEYKQFIIFLLTYSVLEFDCDVYGLLLDLSSENGLPRGQELQKKFLARTKQLREERFDWLVANFPNDILRERIGRNILWIKSKGLNKFEKVYPKNDFARHHASPRKGWAESLGHIDGKGFLTPEGEDILERIRGGRNRYFWIAPSEACYEKLKLQKEPSQEVYGPAWNLIRGNNESKDCMEIMIDDISQFMIDAYPTVKLSSMNQASLNTIIPYFYYLEKKYNCRLDKEVFFKELFSKQRDLFAPMSSRSSVFGHYQIRRSK